MRVKIYIEGGGDEKALKLELRQGFTAFFERAGFKGKMPRTIACGTRGKAFSDFRAALKASNSDEFIILLVDSEQAVKPGVGPWTHLAARDGWTKPETATDEHAHLMVQCMESWFLADKQSLADYYGKDFKPNALPANPDCEQVEKKDVLDGLDNATRQTTKGKYEHGALSFEIIGRIDPQKVFSAPHAKRLRDTLEAKTAS